MIYGIYKYRVYRNERISPTTILLTLVREPDSRPFSFQPGQYAAISFKNAGRPTAARTFSIDTSLPQQDYLQFGIRAKGRYTSKIAELKSGESVSVQGPYGDFILHPNGGRDIVMIAGGIGITPFVSMLRFAGATGMKNRISLLYGVNNQNDAPFAEQLLETADANPRLSVSIAVSSGQIDKFAGRSVRSGRITPEMIDEAVGGRYENKTYYICGPSGFMNAMSQTLLDRGVDADDIISEAFGQGSKNVAKSVGIWPLNVYLWSGVGLVAVSAIVMANELIKALPSVAIPKNNESVINQTQPSVNRRQKDLDDLINNDDDDKQSAKPSSNTNSSGAVSNNKPPTPPPTTNTAPRCTTTQSGVTTCV